MIGIALTLRRARAFVSRGINVAVDLLGSLPIPPQEVLAIARWVTLYGDQLIRALDEYDTAWPGGSAARDALADSITAEAAAEGSLSHESFQRISVWGFRRRVPGLDDDSVRSATREAFRLRAAGQQDAAIRALCDLPGVGVSTASKVLAMSDPDRSAIYDSRAATALHELRDQDGRPLIPIPPGRGRRGSGTSSQHADAYPHYLLILRAIVIIARLVPRLRRLRTIEDVEKALFVLGGRLAAE